MYRYIEHRCSQNVAHLYPEQTTVTLLQMCANNDNIDDIPLPTKPCSLTEGTFIK